MAATSVPLTNTTALNTEIFHGWMGNPRTRGTSEILYTCTFAISLCVYTAVHLNIPSPTETNNKQYLRRAAWVLLGIIGPELVVLTAWIQFDQAWRLAKTLQEIEQKHRSSTSTEAEQPTIPPKDGSRQTSEELTDDAPFDLVYGFYVVMGGFYTRLNDQSRILRPELVTTLARHGFFCRIPRRTIQDRSKSNSLAKALITFQIIWLCSQTIARLVTHLPLSLLEIHTFAHCVAAALMYACWFRKPLDIGESVEIQVPDEYQQVFGFREGLRSRALNMYSDYEEDGTSCNLYDVTRQSFLRLCAAVDYATFEFVIAGSFLQALYAAVHLAAWNFVFPTAVELWLWRASGLWMGLYFPIMALSLAGWFYSKRWPTSVALSTWWSISIVMVAARTFLVTESIISLRAVPIGVYATIPWANYIPHI